MGIDIGSIVIAFYVIVVSGVTSTKPNVVFIVADDLGWNDVSFHGSDQIQTPNIDSLAMSGVALNRYYTHCQCTPSRAAILTGKYAHRTGMQGYPLTNGEDRGLPLTEKILPEYLKELGYSTHLVGKWHQGHSRFAYLPTFRGFDTHYGHRGGYVDYYEYNLEETWVTVPVSGLDLYRNLTADWAAEGYITDIYTEEAKNIISRHDPSRPLFLMVGHNAPHAGNDGTLLQAPPADVRAMRHVESPERRVFGAMMKKLDESVGEIVEALNDKQILNNTIIVFISDNGAPTGITPNYGSNWPLRGSKMSAWDGGIRTVGLVWSLNENFKKNVWDGYMHASDWLPTLLGAIGGAPQEGIDGKNQWNNIIENRISDRAEIYEIDDYTGFGAYISGDYKLVIGDLIEDRSVHLGGELQGIIGSPPQYIEAVNKSKIYQVLRKWRKEFDLNGMNLMNDSKIHCYDKEFDRCFTSKDKWCLYNILEDPCEKEDLSAKYPEIGAVMIEKYWLEDSKRIPRQVPLFRDPRALPKLFNYTWTSFIDIGESGLISGELRIIELYSENIDTI